MVNGIIKTNSNGIYLSQSVSFKNCINGIYIYGKVNGSNSGILINADIGDNNSNYGIN